MLHLFLFILSFLSYRAHAGQYQFSIPSILLQQTRSPHRDTLVGAIYVNGTGVQPASMTKLLGDQGGSKPVTFHPDEFSVKFTATDDASVQVSFTLLNKGDAAGPDQQG